MPKKNENTLELVVPEIIEGKQIKGKIISKNEKGIILSCENDSFCAIVMPKEMKDLERQNVDLSIGNEMEVEILSTDIIHEEGYYLVSITRLLQHDVWNMFLQKADTQEVITVIPNEANLGGLIIDMHGIKGFIPLSQLSPVNYPRVEDGNQEKIFEKLISLIGKEFKVKVINIDEETRRVIFSEKEVMKEAKEKLELSLKVGDIYNGIITGSSAYGFFVAIEGVVEGLVHISEITYGHVDNIDKFGKSGDNIQVKVISNEPGKISLSMKQIKPDPRSIIPEKFHAGDVIQGEIIRFVPYGAFMRMYDDINGLIHITEITDKIIHNPAEELKLGQTIKAKIITLDSHSKKIGLSIRALICEEKGISYEISTAAKQAVKPNPVRKFTKNVENVENIKEISE